MKLLFFILIFFSSLISEENSCDIEVKYRVEHTSADEDDGRIFITIERGTEAFELNLFDENAPEKGFIKSKKFDSYRLNSEILVFSGLKPSSYIVRIDNTNCKTSISGLDGIIIN